MKYHSKWARLKKEIKGLRAEGKTLEQVGEIYGVSRQRIHQIITRRRAKKQHLNKQKDLLYNVDDGTTELQWDSRSIQALRRYLGLTQRQMANRLGTRQQTISEWETGRYRPRGASATLLTITAERASFKYEAERPVKGAT